MIDRLLDSLARRFSLDTAHGRVLRRKVPPWVGYSFCFGGITFALFGILLATGLILAFPTSPPRGEHIGALSLLSTMCRSEACCGGSTPGRET